VSINCPYSTETHHLIGPEQFELMRSSAYLVNTARGPIVDESALVQALRGGSIAGAGLDVYEHEPRLEQGLNELDNSVLIPHLGSATVETRAAMATLAARNAVAVLSGQPALTPVT
jgi:glyoxylate reductase